LAAAEREALACEFGSGFERKLVYEEHDRGTPLQQGGRVRLEYVRRFIEQRSNGQDCRFATAELPARRERL
jgi:hypothetical protein